MNYLTKLLACLAAALFIVSVLPYAIGMLAAVALCGPLLMTGGK